MPSISSDTAQYMEVCAPSSGVYCRNLMVQGCFKISYLSNANIAKKREITVD